MGKLYLLNSLFVGVLRPCSHVVAILRILMAPIVYSHPPLDFEIKPLLLFGTPQQVGTKEQHINVIFTSFFFSAQNLNGFSTALIDSYPKCLFLVDDFHVSSYYAFVDNHRQIPLYKQDI